MIVNCDFCNLEFKTYPNWYNRNEHHCCSRTCSFKLKSKLTEKQCSQCNKLFQSKSHQLDRKFCSKECFIIWNRGENNHFYRIDKEIDLRYREDSNFKRWAKLVKERDEYHCKNCGCDNREELQAHHINALSKDKDSRFDISNGITLCIGCHANEHLNDTKTYKLILSHYKRLSKNKEYEETEMDN